MRQAGRYMPEYRAIREKHGLLEIIETPELAVEVTLQPIRAFRPDAAIVFGDILPLLTGMGARLEFAHGEGPVIHNPVRSARDIDALVNPPVEESTRPTLETVSLVAKELSGHTPVVGFAGAPFTLAAYLIEAGSSKNYERVKGLMMADPVAWHRLMHTLAQRVGRYLKLQADAGASALQIFDSWAGALSPSDYAAHVLPFTREAIQVASEAGVPVIHFSTGTSGFIGEVSRCGAQVLSVDWRTSLDHAWTQVGEGFALQGNLDPVALLASWEALRARVDAVLASAGDRSGHIFNVGHGILPATHPDNVRRVVDYVHSVTERLPA
jgi:uroporphyrinogen decarboxylase